jgi:hypothetical protein
VSASLIALGFAANCAPAFSAPFPPEFELSELQLENGGDGSKGFVLNETEEHSQAGSSVSEVGDVNGDGIDDFIVGAPFTYYLRGAAFVVFGREGVASFPAEFDLSSLLSANGGDGSEGFVVLGVRDYDLAGHSVGSAGDINGDGVGDLVIGAPQDDVNGSSGRAYVVFGRGPATSGFPAEFELRSLHDSDGSEGFVVHGYTTYDFLGRSVSGLGDVNGDGIDDLAIGATGSYYGYGRHEGRSYIIFGRDHALENFPGDIFVHQMALANGGDGTVGVIVHGVSDGDMGGLCVSGVGDVNDDGINDLLIGSRVNESYVLFGRDQLDGFPSELELSNLLPRNGGDGSTGFVVRRGEQPCGLSSSSVNGAGEVNGDRIDDLLLGNYVVFGRSRLSAGFSAILRLSELLPVNGGDGSEGFVLKGTTGPMNDAGDVNADGLDDLLTGNAVVFGRHHDSDAFPATFAISSLLPANGGDGSKGFILKNPGSQEFWVRAVSGAGDINRDGVDDLIIGTRLGETYVVFGRSGIKCQGLDVTLVGTDGSDEIIGTPGSDVINGRKGNDVIRGLGGDDIICGGKGFDVIYGDGGNDTLFGERGNDTLLGGSGIDRLIGGLNDDLLKGGGGNDHLDGGSDFDRCNGGDGTGDTAANCERLSNIP